MKKATFKISQMDCPSEEQMIRMALADNSEIELLDFDIPSRKLEVVFKENLKPIEAKLEGLNLGAHLLDVKEYRKKAIKESDEPDSKRRLILVLIINFAFFIIEMVFGLISQSMGLIADSLDMLADSFVYGLSLYAIWLIA